MIEKLYYRWEEFKSSDNPNWVKILVGILILWIIGALTLGVITLVGGLFLFFPLYFIAAILPFVVGIFAVTYRSRNDGEF